MTDRSPRRQEQRRVARCVRMLDMIRSEPGRWQRRGFSAMFGVSERAIDHDLALLRGAGFPIRRRRGGYEESVQATE